MSGIGRLEINNASLQELIELRDGMGRNDHLRGTPRSIYVQRGSQLHEDQVDFRTASSYGDAKARVREIVAKQVGGKKADAIMEEAFETENKPRRDGWNRFWWPNRKAITRKDLNQVIKLTYQETKEQFNKISPKQREILIERLKLSTNKDPAAFMRDKQVNKLAHLVAGNFDRSQETRFLDAVHEFESQLQKFKQLDEFGFIDLTGGDPPNGAGGRKRSTEKFARQAKQIWDTFLAVEAPDKLWDSDSIRKEFSNTDFENMSSDQLMTIFKQAKAVVAKDLQTFSISELVKELKKASTEHRRILSYRDQGASNDVGDQALAELTQIRDQLEDGYHLRQQGGFLYTKCDHPGVEKPTRWSWNHAKTRLFSNRAEKFQAAKRTVQDLLAKSLQEIGLKEEDAKERAERIMQPWLSSDKALGHEQLDSIIEKVNELSTLQNDVTKLLRARKARDELDMLSYWNCCERGDEERELFARYLGIRGGQHELTKLDDLRDLSRVLGVLQNIPEQNKQNQDFDLFPGNLAAFGWPTDKHLVERVRDSHGSGDLSSKLTKLLRNPEKMTNQEVRGLKQQIEKLRNSQSALLEDTYFDQFIADCYNPAAVFGQAVSGELP